VSAKISNFFFQATIETTDLHLVGA